MSTTVPQDITLGNMVTISTVVQLRDPATGVLTPSEDSDIQLYLRAPSGDEEIYSMSSSPAIVYTDNGYHYLDVLPDEVGSWEWRWVGSANAQGASEGHFGVGSAYVSRITSPNDIRVLAPRVQRAVEGVVRAQWTLTADEVKDLVADAIADVVLYTGSIFGSQLIVTHVDPVTQAPDEYATSVPIVPEQGSVIAAQAALNYFFYRFSGAKMSEHISDEASSWEYSLSPNLLAAQLKLLKDERDLALQSIAPPLIGMDAYVSFLAQRDNVTARLVEPWVYGHPEGYGIGAGGLEGDFRFDQLPSGGGDYSGLS